MAKKNQVQHKQAFQVQGKQSWKFASAMVCTFFSLGAIAANAQQAKHQDVQIKQGNASKQSAVPNLLKGTVQKEPQAKPNADLVNRYGDAANDPAVAGALRKAQGKLSSDEVKAKIEADVALRNGIWTPGANPNMAIMYGYVPPNMTPEHAAMMSRVLPKMPTMPQPMSPEMISRMAGEPVDPMSSLMPPEPMTPYVPYPDSIRHNGPKTLRLQRIPQGQMAGIPRMPNIPGLPNVPGMPNMMMGYGSGSGIPGALSRSEIAAQNQKFAEESIRARYGPVNVPILQRDPSWLAKHGRKAEGGFIVESDHQSVVGVCDENGNEITAIQYDPWGNHTVLKGTELPAFMYKGMYWHDRSGKYLTLYRAYDPKLGRWISRDPLGERAGTNLYTFARNNPIKYSDPLGLDVWIEGSAGFPEAALHRSLGVGDPLAPNYDYYSQSYGMTGLDQGAVYPDPMKGGPIEKYAKCTKAQDKAIKDDLEKFKDFKGCYGLFNCRTYSEVQFDWIMQKYGLTPSEAPYRPYPESFNYAIPTTTSTTLLIPK